MKVVGDRKRIMRFVHHFIFLLLVPFFFFSWTGVSLSIENEECLGCHGTRDILEMSEEERLEMVVPTPGKKEVRKGKLTLYVDYKGFRSSVHSELSCVDCHTGIEDLPHPQRMGMVDCAQCHEEIVGQYEKSKHAKASERLCFECHNPHVTTSFRRLSQKERMGICLQCHKKKGHRWLPQRELHFRYLECTVCHAPNAEKGLFFHLTAEQEDGKRITLSYKQLKDFTRGYQGDVAKAIDRNGNNLVEVHEINRFIAKLKEGGIRSPRIEEEVLVLQPYHNYTDEVEHIKDCAMCHTSGAPFYSRVMLRVPEERGRWPTSKMDKAIIGKIPPIPSKDYYFATVHGQNGVECIDCHADLTILREGEEFKVKELETPVCEQCHEDVMEEYKNSLHYKVSEEICFGCHDPHSSIPFKDLDVEQRKAICMKCHDPEMGHDWLPQRGIHFRYLECTMCHAPQAEKGMVFYLQMVDRKGVEKRLKYGEVAELLGMENPDLVKLLDGDGNGFLEAKEILSFLKSMREKDEERVELGAMVLVLKPFHNYTDKGTKAKDCSLCHSSQAEFYSKLVMEIPEQGGGIRTLPLDKDTLVGIHTIPVTSPFYLLGESRISKRDIAALMYAVKKGTVRDSMYAVRKIGYKWLDVIGILFLLGGLGFVILHGLIRVLTRGMRAKGRP
ncbi:MAG: cytochrome c3 family protein [Deltaproteobacteria bacterium]|nr:cytochrome c3 family protein [Deltaproteobacteria bacterium]